MQTFGKVIVAGVLVFAALQFSHSLIPIPARAL